MSKKARRNSRSLRWLSPRDAAGVDEVPVCGWAPSARLEFILGPMEPTCRSRGGHDHRLGRRQHRRARGPAVSRKHAGMRKLAGTRTSSRTSARRMASTSTATRCRRRPSSRVTSSASATPRRSSSASKEEGEQPVAAVPPIDQLAPSGAAGDAPVRLRNSMARLLFRDSQGREGTVELSPTETVYVGRGLECAIRTDDGMVSRRHSQIRMEGGRFVVEDLGSANVTHLKTHACRSKPSARRRRAVWLADDPFHRRDRRSRRRPEQGQTLGVAPLRRRAARWCSSARAPPPRRWRRWLLCIRERRVRGGGLQHAPTACAAVVARRRACGPAGSAAGGNFGGARASGGPNRRPAANFGGGPPAACRRKLRAHPRAALPGGNLAARAADPAAASAARRRAADRCGFGGAPTGARVAARRLSPPTAPVELRRTRGFGGAPPAGGNFGAPPAATSVARPSVLRRNTRRPRSASTAAAGLGPRVDGCSPVAGSADRRRLPGGGRGRQHAVWSDHPHAGCRRRPSAGLWRGAGAERIARTRIFRTVARPVCPRWRRKGTSVGAAEQHSLAAAAVGSVARRECRCRLRARPGAPYGGPPRMRAPEAMRRMADHQACPVVAAQQVASGDRPRCRVQAAVPHTAGRPGCPVREATRRSVVPPACRARPEVATRPPAVGQSPATRACSTVVGR